MVINKLNRITRHTTQNSGDHRNVSAKDQWASHTVHMDYGMQVKLLSYVPTVPVSNDTRWVSN